MKTIRSNLIRLNNQFIDADDRDQFWRAVKQQIDYVNSMREEDAFDSGYAAVAQEVREVECEYNVHEAKVRIQRTLEVGVKALKDFAEADNNLSVVSTPGKNEDHRRTVQDWMAESKRHADECIVFATHEALFYRTNKPKELTELLTSANVVSQCRDFYQRDNGWMSKLYMERVKAPLAERTLASITRGSKWWVIDVTRNAKGTATWSDDGRTGLTIQTSSICFDALQEAIMRSREHMVHLRDHAVQAVQASELLLARRAQSGLNSYGRLG